MSEDNPLTVALVTSHLIEADEYPEGPCVVLTGDKEAVKEASLFFGDQVAIVPASFADEAAELRKENAALRTVLQMIADGKPMIGEMVSEIVRRMQDRARRVLGNA